MLFIHFLSHLIIFKWILQYFLCERLKIFTFYFKLIDKEKKVGYYKVVKKTLKKMQYSQKPNNNWFFCTFFTQKWMYFLNEKNSTFKHVRYSTIFLQCIFLYLEVNLTFFKVIFKMTKWRQLRRLVHKSLSVFS